MENKKYTHPFALFPNYFKKIGVVIVILAFITAVVIKLYHVSMTEPQKDFYKILLPSIFIMGLFFIAVAKDKNEDERTTFLRTSSMSVAFLFSVMSVFVTPVSYFFSDEMVPQSVQSFVVTMLLIYLAYFYARKILE